MGTLVHATMGEPELAYLRGRGYGVGVEEPYQHYQFAGRADVVAWDLGIPTPTSHLPGALP